ncbi:MAG TPA: CoA ester lyase [Acidimicrobiales bacterium]|nr:CoA ester lyase [Acidimicrobiales bacterium]
MRTPLRLRSLLFAPASRPDVLAKLPRADPDGVVLDLEDAVAPSAKADARDHSREAGAMLAREYPQLAVYVRVNAMPTEWFADDIARGVPAGAIGVVVPKIESAAQIMAAGRALDRAGLHELSILVGIETVAGVINVAEILHEARVAACYFGAEDYTADLGGVRRADSLEVLWPRSRVAAHAARAGVLSMDQVVTDLHDEDAFRLDAQMGRSLGYRGKLCIHPSQVAWANESFSPSAAEVERARRLIEAFEEATALGHGTISFEGQMVDEPLARRARAVIAGAEG